jgi:aminopeptidase N
VACRIFPNHSQDTSADKAFVARTIGLPSENELYESRPGCDPVAFHAVRAHMLKQIAARMQPELRAALAANDCPPGTPYSPDAASAARRALKNKCLGYLSSLEDPEITKEVLNRYGATSTDILAPTPNRSYSACLCSSCSLCECLSRHEY